MGGSWRAEILTSSSRLLASVLKMKVPPAICMKTNGQDKMSRMVRGALRSGIGALIERDVKNEGTSGDLYENKE